jgi:hypothetical protein
LFADRNMTGETLADDYAARISAEVGVPVTAFNQTVTGLESDRILAMMRNEGFPQLGDLVAGAEVVVVNGTPGETLVGTPADDIIGACLGASSRQREVSGQLTLEEMRPYIDMLKEVYGQVATLRAGAPTVLIAMDHYNPFLGGWRDAGIESECTQVWETFSESVETAAAEYGIPFVSMYDTLNGPDHDVDAEEAGYLNNAMWQANETGTAMMVDALMAAGLTPMTP